MSEKVKVAVLISGYGSNLQALIDACRRKDYPAQITVVGSNRLDAYGLVRAKEEGIETFAAELKSSEANEELFDFTFRDYGVELICLAGFMKILSSEFVEKWEGRILNIHPSLLPSFKGLNAPKQALDAGVKISGCTVHYVIPELDAGPIISQRCCKVLDTDTVGTLTERIQSKEHALYPEALEIAANRILGAC